MITKDDLFKPGCGEISGFGGGYEECCRDMVTAGVNWCLDNPEKAKNISYKGFQNVYGLCITNSPEAEELDKVLLATCDGSTGAMHQASVNHIMWINTHSVKAYAEEMLKRGDHEDN